MKRVLFRYSMIKCSTRLINGLWTGASGLSLPSSPHSLIRLAYSFYQICVAGVRFGMGENDMGFHEDQVGFVRAV